MATRLREQLESDRARAAPFEFQEEPPHPWLADLLESVWSARGTIAYGRERILPTPLPVLIVNLGTPFVVRASKAPPGDDVRRQGWLAGPQRGYVENQPLAETDVIGVTLKPWGPTALFDVRADELADRIVDLDALWGPGLDVLRERLAATTSPRRRRTTMMRALIARRRTGPPDAIASTASGLASGNIGSVSSATRELRVSRKHLNHLFGRYVGLPPRDFARVHRFDRALRALGSEHVSSLAAIAHEHGYYDQSHMNRDFLSFASVTPTEYRRLRAAHLTPEIDDSGLFIPGI